ncbi:hypothetical protein [Streptomyces sp. NPDC127084]|uniref:hypothetical protein n=1 Tax=Streptomyces sp. NPDC127084 TaxID=3347133 RepID=UPI003653829D
MADERYPWLDQEAAERLLRGEEAALAAFRKVREGGADELLPTAVRLGGAESGTYAAPVASAGPRSRRRPGPWGRPMRWGLAASLAGFAVGGVAVAAGVGALTGPFGEENTPMPGASVSAQVSPDSVESGSMPGDSDTLTPDGPTTGEGGAIVPPSPGAEEPTGGADGGGTDSPDSPRRDDKKDGDHSWEWGDGRDISRSEWYAKTRGACRDYRSGRLDEDDKRQLESLAKGADRVTRFCDRLLDADGDSGNGNSGSDSSGDDDNGTDGDGRGGNDDRGGDSVKGLSDGNATEGTDSLTAVPASALSLSAAISVY